MDRINLDSYKPNQILTFCKFDSTTTDIRVAYDFSYKGITNESDKDFNNELFVFKIHLCNENQKVATNIQLNTEMSEYAYEKEVLLLPFFTFRVVEVTKT